MRSPEQAGMEFKLSERNSADAGETRASLRELANGTVLLKLGVDEYRVEKPRRSKGLDDRGKVLFEVRHLYTGAESRLRVSIVVDCGGKNPTFSVFLVPRAGSAILKRRLLIARETQSQVDRWIDSLVIPEKYPPFISLVQVRARPRDEGVRVA